MSTLHVENLKGLSSGSNANKIIVPSGQTLDASAGTLTPSAGAVVQVKYFDNDTAISLNLALTWTDAISVSFTPLYATSKVLLIAKTSISGPSGNYDTSMRLLRDGTAIGGNNDPSNLFAGDNILASTGYTSGEAGETIGGQYLDSPATTSAITYKIQVIGGENVTTYSVNRPYSANANGHYCNTGDTSLTLMEIAG